MRTPEASRQDDDGADGERQVAEREKCEQTEELGG
jgi:hypothetical protein